MRFALVGDHHDGLELAQALAASAHHRLVVFSGEPRTLERLERRNLSPRYVPDLEEVLADPEVEAVIVAGAPAARSAQLKRALQAERHVLCVAPADESPNGAYEAELLQRDAHCVAMPMLPEAFHLGLRRLASLKLDARLIEIERWSTGDIFIDADEPGHRPGLPGWETLRLLGGDLAEVFAQSPDPEDYAARALLLTGRFSGGGLFQVTLLPNQARHLYRISVVGTDTRMTLTFPEGWPGPSTLEYPQADGTVLTESWPPYAPWPDLLEAFDAAVQQLGRHRPGEPSESRSMTAEPPRLGWEDEVRALELDDAVRRSILMRRSSELDELDVGEEVNFKSTMTLVGCSLIWASIAVLVLSIWIPWAAWIIAPAFLVYLGLQLLRWIVPASEKGPSPGATPRQQSRPVSTEAIEEPGGRDRG